MAGEEFNLKLNDKYILKPFLEVEKDNIEELFRNGVGVYICNYPDEFWYKHHGFKQETNYSIEKKQRFFKLLGDNAKILSLTEDSKISKKTRTYREGNIIHFGSSFKGRIAQLIMSIKLINWLFKYRKTYDFCLCYNFYPGEMLGMFFAKYFLNKKIILDFEDDYLLKKPTALYKVYFNLVKRIPDDVICINIHMKKYFKSKKAYVFNGFIDLSYTKRVDYNLKENFTLLYSGALDEIRGVDLIPEIIANLKKEYKNFKILITGSGPLLETVKEWDIPEVNFLGFLSSEDYNKVIKSVTGCLVLQKPDLPFTKGSFPSKIEYYSKHKKPVYKIELNE